MTQPTRTPNPATSSRPERSSKRVAHKSPLAWLPLALLALLLLLLLAVVLTLFAVNDGTTKNSTSRPGSSAAPVPGSPGSAGPAAGSAGPAAGPAAGGGTAGSAGPAAGGGTAGSAGPAAGGGTAGGGAGVGGAGVPSGPLAGALVGGAGIAPAAVGSTGAGGASGTAGGTTATGGKAPGSAGTVLFGEGSASIDSYGRQVIRQAATTLKAARAPKVEVIGYTDVLAGQPVNQSLSAKRAAAVAAALRTELGPDVAVTTSARGEQDPAASNSTAPGRQQNRRAAILQRG